MFARILLGLLWLAIGIGALVAAWPGLFGLQREYGVVQFVALRGAVTLVAILLIVGFAILARFWRSGRRLLGGLIVIGLLFTLLEGVVLVSRGFGLGAMPVATKDAVTVFEWNTLGGRPGIDAIVAAIEAEDPDIVVLPETQDEHGSEIAARLDADGYPMQRFTGATTDGTAYGATTLLVARRLGQYRQLDALAIGGNTSAVYAGPVEGEGPRILGLHLAAPREARIPQWRAELEWLAAQCAEPAADLIVAGDLNATIDHWQGLAPARDGMPATAIGGCADAAAGSGAAALGTWPAAVPIPLGAPIDHVLSTAQWRAVGFRVLDVGGSDHRPIVARLVPER